MKKKTDGKTWIPRSFGKIIVERKLIFKAKGKASRQILVQVGCPVRKPTANENDPWVCPLRILGFKPDFKTFIFGIDSLQALTLALDTAESILPSIAQGMGGTIIFLEPRAPLIYNTWPKDMSEEITERLKRASRRQK